MSYVFKYMSIVLYSWMLVSLDSSMHFICLYVHVIWYDMGYRPTLMCNSCLCAINWMLIMLLNDLKLARLMR